MAFQVNVCLIHAQNTNVSGYSFWKYLEHVHICPNNLPAVSDHKQHQQQYLTSSTSAYASCLAPGAVIEGYNL